MGDFVIVYMVAALIIGAPLVAFFLAALMLL